MVDLRGGPADGLEIDDTGRTAWVAVIDGAAQSLPAEAEDAIQGLFNRDDIRWHRYQRTAGVYEHAPADRPE